MKEGMGRKCEVWLSIPAAQPDLPGCFSWRCSDGHSSASGVSECSTFHVILLEKSPGLWELYCSFATEVMFWVLLLMFVQTK